MGMLEDKSFEALAVPQLGAVYRVARRLCRREEDADDLVQETFLRAFRAFGRFEMRQFGILPWLLRILHNAYITRGVRQGRAPRSAEHDQLDETAGADGGWWLLPDLDYERLDEEVLHAIDLLHEDYRTVLILWATNELSYQQIADTLNVPAGTVMSRLYRARQQLALSLQDYAKQRRLGSKT